MTPWLGGLHIRAGQVPVADWLCGWCLAHRRATGQRRVIDLVASDPTANHRGQCPARPEAHQP